MDVCICPFVIMFLSFIKWHCSGMCVFVVVNDIMQCAFMIIKCLQGIAFTGLFIGIY